MGGLRPELPIAALRMRLRLLLRGRPGAAARRTLLNALRSCMWSGSEGVRAEWPTAAAAAFTARLRGRLLRWLAVGGGWQPAGVTALASLAMSLGGRGRRAGFVSAGAPGPSKAQSKCSNDSKLGAPAPSSSSRVGRHSSCGQGWGRSGSAEGTAHAGLRRSASSAETITALRVGCAEGTMSIGAAELFTWVTNNSSRAERATHLDA